LKPSCSVTTHDFYERAVGQGLCAKPGSYSNNTLHVDTHHVRSYLLDQLQLRVVVFNNFSSTAAVGDFRSDDDSRLANGIVMIIVLPRSSVSVAVGVRVLIGLDSEKLVRTNCVRFWATVCKTVRPMLSDVVCLLARLQT